MRAYEIFEAISISNERQQLRSRLAPVIKKWSKLLDEEVDLNSFLDDLQKVIPEINLDFGTVNSSEFVASGELLSDLTIKVNIDTNNLLYGPYNIIENPKHWLDLFIMTISHELLHQQQMSKSNNVGYYVSDDEIEYLSHPLEIQAHAKDAVDHLAKFVNSKEELFNMLNDPIESLKIDSEPFGNYIKYFRDYDPKIWKRFLKYVHFYANEYIF